MKYGKESFLFFTFKTSFYKNKLNYKSYLCSSITYLKLDGNH